MNDEYIDFNIIDISSDDIPMGSDYYDKDFLMTFYGKTKDDKNIVCNIIGFKPYFYIRIPSNCGTRFTERLLKSIREFIKSKPKVRGPWDGSYDNESLEICKYYNFYGYNYNSQKDDIEKYKFAKISFKTHGCMKKCISAVQSFFNENIRYVSDNRYIKEYKNNNEKLEVIDANTKAWFFQEHNCECSANLYESKIHPLLRFLHEKDIQSCGWIRVNNYQKYVASPYDQNFNVDIEINNIHMKNVEPIESENIAGFITASFDIECDSSHGDFPNANKDFMKLAIDVQESYFRESINATGSDIIKKAFIEKCIKEAFSEGSNNIQNIYTSNGIYSENSLKSIMMKVDSDMITILDKSKDNSKTRDLAIKTYTKLFNTFKNENGEKIIIKGDPIIQIGTTFHRYGDSECYNRSIVVIGNENKPDEKVCDSLNEYGIDVYECDSEKELLLKWKDLILYHNPDLITGYNIFGFDFNYIIERVDIIFPCTSKCKKTFAYSNCDNNCPKNDFYRIGRLMRNRASDRIASFESLNQKLETKKSYKSYNNFWEKRCQPMKKELSSSGLGDNILKYIGMDGRIVFDIQKEIQKGHQLDSYKLDNVSAHFMKGEITKRENMFRSGVDDNKIVWNVLHTKQLGNLKDGDYITINLITKYGEIKYKDNKKFRVYSVDRIQNKLVIEHYMKMKKYEKDLIKYEWCLAKDDVSPQDIFNLHKNGGSEGRAKIAKYCIMDCELCIYLLLQLDLIPNNIGMACVSHVPLSYIFLRGQGIKISSLVTKECSFQNTKIPTLKNYNEIEGNEEGFEGAIVLEPTPGIYLDDPVSVLDYASLYPSSIIEKNLSHETFICTQSELDESPEKYEWIQYNKSPEDNVNVISYDDYNYEQKGKTTHKIKAGTQTTCYFKKADGDENDMDRPLGIIPTILQTLLTQRKNTRKKIKLTDDDNKKKVLDGLQLAYKVTANSVYGQMGARTSSIFFKKIAACTTSIGRERIYDARDGVVAWAENPGPSNKTDFNPTGMSFHKPIVVYGDTDSVFVKFSRIHHETGKELEGKEALEYCIQCGVEAGEWITKYLMHKPQDLEYEKTFYPFILISKKRYTGDKYELKADKPKERTSMGIVMKRRDNAAIVKYVFGNVIEIIMNQKSVDKAMEWLDISLKKIIEARMPESMFIISKSLRGYYKNPDGIAHKVLADRMAERNPGDKPKPNDRIPYMYIKPTDEQLYDYDNRYKSGPRKGKPREKKILQGDRIEAPDYIRENDKLFIDFAFYISNQIMVPVKQVLDLVKDEELTSELFNKYL